MGGTTPIYGLPYPTGTDRVADGDNAIQALALQIESVLSGSVAGGQWKAYTPTFTASSGTPSVGTGGNAALSGRYTRWGRLIVGNGFLRFGTVNPNSGTGAWRLGLPVAAAATPQGLGAGTIVGSGFMEDSAVKGYLMASLRFQSTTALELLFVAEQGAYAAGSTALVSNTQPFAWGGDDWCSWSFAYEAGS